MAGKRLRRGAAPASQKGSLSIQQLHSFPACAAACSWRIQHPAATQPYCPHCCSPMSLAQHTPSVTLPAAFVPSCHDGNQVTRRDEDLILMEDQDQLSLQ